MSKVEMTTHAGRRAQQRAVPPWLVELVVRHADLELPLGERRMALRLSPDAVATLRRDHGMDTAERARSVVLVMVDGVVATVLRAIGKPSRRYLWRRR